MQIERYSNVNSRLKVETLQFLEAVSKIDGTVNVPYIGNEYNVYENMPALCICYDEQKIIGIAVLYHDQKFEAPEVGVVVHPEYRLQGISRLLISEVDRIIKEWQLLPARYYVESVILKQHPQLAQRLLKLESQPDTSILVVTPETLNQPENSQNIILRTLSSDEIEEVSKEVAKVFQVEIEQEQKQLHAVMTDEQSTVYVWQHPQTEEILGMCCTSQVQSMTYLFSIAVWERFQGKGYATAGLSQIISLLFKQGVSRVQLDVEPDNIAGMRLYHNIGFCHVSDMYECAGYK